MRKAKGGDLGMTDLELARACFSQASMTSDADTARALQELGRRFVAQAEARSKISPPANRPSPSPAERLRNGVVRRPAVVD